MQFSSLVNPGWNPLEYLSYLEKVEEKLPDTPKDAVVAMTQFVLTVRAHVIAWVGPLVLYLQFPDDNINGPFEGVSHRI